jgi:SAM-dependent methyltransferase
LSQHTQSQHTQSQHTDHDRNGRPDEHWYTDFFTELPNEFWRRVATPDLTRADVDFVERELALAPRSTVLDVPCGSGRHSIELAARGHRVVGYDISAEAIDHARRAAGSAGIDLDFFEADMRAVPSDGRFDAVVCLGNSFGYLDLQGTRDFVAAIAAALRPGGGLVVDFNVTAESVLPGFTGEPRSMSTGDITVVTTTEYDLDRSRLISHYRFSRGDRVLDTTAVHHVYTSGNLGQLLRDGGFVDLRRFAGPDSSPYRVGAGRLLLTARRR